MPKRHRTKMQKRREEKKANIRRIADLLLAVYAMGDDYLQSVCENIYRAQDGGSKRRQEQLARAMEYRGKCRELYGYFGVTFTKEGAKHASK